MIKWIKYNLLHHYQSFMIAYSIFLLGCIALPFLLANHTMKFFMNFLIVGASAFVFGLFIAVFIMFVNNYETAMYKNEGYLTNTLPLSTSSLVGGQLIANFIWLIFSALVLMIGGLFGATSSYFAYHAEIVNDFPTFGHFLKTLFSTVQILSGELLHYGFGALVSMLSFIAFTYCISTIIHLRPFRKHKILWGGLIVAVWMFILLQFPQFSGMQIFMGENTFYVGSSALYDLAIGVFVNVVEIVFYLGITIYLHEHYLEME